MQQKRKILFLFCAFLLRGQLGWAQDLMAAFNIFPQVDHVGELLFTPAERHARAVRQDSEFEPNNYVARPAFAANPLLLEGKPLNYGNFDFFSKGVLTVVKGQPETTEAAAIPFYVQIRRKGKILTKKIPFANKILYKINLSEIFPFAEDGDMLIIKPARAEDWQGKRILKLIGGC